MENKGGKVPHPSGFQKEFTGIILLIIGWVIIVADIFLCTWLSPLPDIYHSPAAGLLAMLVLVIGIIIFFIGAILSVKFRSRAKKQKNQNP